MSQGLEQLGQLTVPKELVGAPGRMDTLSLDRYWVSTLYQ